MYYDLCQSKVALREKKQKLLLQHITSRGSRLTPLKSRRPLVAALLSPPPPISPRFSGFFWAREWCRGRDAGRTVPAGCFSTLIRPLTGLHRPVPLLVTPTCWALCHLSSLLHMNSMQFYGVHLLPLLLFSCLSTKHWHRIRLQRMVNVLLLWRPSDSNKDTLKHGSWWQTKVLLLIFSQIEYTECRAEPFALCGEGDSSSCWLY